jgi:hypothetical protein
LESLVSNHLNKRSHEFKEFAEACIASPLYKKAIAEFDLPEGFVVTIDPVCTTFPQQNI